ncbi:MAG: ABC transporter permease [Deltaproteobacteria bacterium]|nr:MAG: ABC transporter permease [Deltaproteobacteria bacterium]
MHKDVTEESARISEFRRFYRVFFSRGVVVFGIIVIIALIITAIFAPWMAPYDPYALDMSKTILQPCKEHLLGTDALGRDMLSRLIFGTRIALMVGVVAVGAAATIGMTMGLLAGYLGGWVSMIFMRLTDALMAFPMVLLALLIAGILGGGLKNVIVALTIGLTPSYARLMYGQVLSIRENDYVLAGRSMGANNVRIMLRHIFPNCMPPLIVQITMMIGMAILAEASLSFLGVGIKPPEAAWGTIVYEGYQYLRTNPTLSLIPGFAIMIVVFSFNMVGDGLRDALDPRLRGVL